MISVIQEWKNRISLGLLLNITVALIFSVTAVFFIKYMNHHMRQEALREAEIKADLILDRNLAIHTYFSHELKPSVFELTDHYRADDYFDPSWMSSTYAVRGIDQYYKDIAPGDYYYKECAINARSPENEADEYEKAFIKELNLDSELEKKSAVREINGTQYYVTLHRGEVMSDSCLRCHSTSKEAPSGLVDLYGDSRSFHRQEGEVVSAISIRVPLSEAFAKAKDISANLSLIFLVILISIFFLQYLFYRFVVSKPLRNIYDKARLISKSKSHLGETIPLPVSRELYQLSDVFNYMSKNLQLYIDQLTDSENKFRTLYENMAEGVFYKNTSGTFTDVNQATLDMLNIKREDFLGHNFDTLDLNVIDEHGQEIQVEQLPSIQALATGKAVLNRITGVFRASDQQYRWLSVNAIPQFKESETVPFQVFVTMHDITEIKKAEKELQNAHNELERRVAERTEELKQIHVQLLHVEKLSAIGRLAASIAHEFNNPLQGVMTVIKGVKRRVPLDAEDSKLIGMALDECTRMKYLIKDLHDFNRPSAGKATLVDIHKAIDSILLLCKKDFKNRSIVVRKEYDSKITTVRGVADQLKQVVLNLLHNAADACVGDKRLVVISTSLCDAHIKISVKDTGKGIPPKDINHLFEPFFTTKSEVKGTGLGLSVSYGIIKRHGGDIKVESKEGGGSTFSVLLPVEGAVNAQ